MSVQEETSGNDLGIARDIDVLDRLVNWDGREVVDCGCGDGSLARALAKRGARVTGIEPDPIQAEKNRNANPIENVTLMEAPAQQLPLGDGSADVVVFSKSLHHVPKEHMDDALKEAARVLRPDGVLYILEPDIRGQFSQMVRPFHDETVVRADALDALARTGDHIFDTVEEYWYTNVVKFDDFEAMVKRMSGSTYNEIDGKRIDTPPVRASFAEGKTEDGYEFTNLMRVRLHRRPKRD